MSQHMSVDEWKKETQQGNWWEDESPVIDAPVKQKRTKKVDADNPIEHIEAVKLKAALETMVEDGKILKFAHLVNELKLDRKKGQKPNFAYLNSRKEEGWKPGVPDYLVILPDGKGIVFIELKRCKGNCASPEQKDWIAAITQAGGYATVAKGAAAAIEYLEKLLY